MKGAESLCQTGKSTLLKRLLPAAAVWLDFSRPAIRSDYLRHPGQLIERCRALEPGKSPPVVVVDEAQDDRSFITSIRSSPRSARFPSASA